MYIESFLRLGGFKKLLYRASSSYFSATCPQCAGGYEIGKFHQKWTNLTKKSKNVQNFLNENSRYEIVSTNTIKKDYIKPFPKENLWKMFFFPFPHVPPDKLRKILILAVPGWRSPINQLIWLRSVKNPFAPSLSCILSIETSKFTSILAKILQECRNQSKLITL